jgi:hypothetical protein
LNRRTQRTQRKGRKNKQKAAKETKVGRKAWRWCRGGARKLGLVAGAEAGFDRAELARQAEPTSQRTQRTRQDLKQKEAKEAKDRVQNGVGGAR